MVISVLFIYSAAINSEGVFKNSYAGREYIKQIIFASTGIAVLLFVSLFDYRKLKRFSLWIYLAIIFFLVVVLLLCHVAKGAKSWFGGRYISIPPSEFGKIAYILFLSWYMEKSENENQLKRFIISLISLAVPVLLILLQPDLGTASVYIAIYLVICFVSHLPLRYIFLCLSTGILMILITVMPIIEKIIIKKDILFFNIFTENKIRLIIIATFAFITILSIIGNLVFKKKYYYWVAYICGILTVAFLGAIVLEKVLKPYQIGRLVAFLNPDYDPTNGGWHIRQSKIAIGSGGFFGLGYLKGSQSHLSFLPQQSTDFIFSIIAEEWGFIGCLFFFILYFIIIYRSIIAMRRTKDTYGYYIIAGIIAMITFHFVVNVGMDMGIMPITGIPLMLVSYGGSSLWTALIGLGLIESVNLRRLEFHKQ